MPTRSDVLPSLPPAHIEERSPTQAPTHAAEGGRSLRSQGIATSREELWHRTVRRLVAAGRREVAVFPPMTRRLLVVVTTDVSDATVRDFVRRSAGEDAELRVVAPASDISRLDWLTNAEDGARADAGALADKTAEAAPTSDVQARVGDSDPVKAIEDALRKFPADEVLVITRPDDDASWLVAGSGEIAQTHFRLPIRLVTVAADGSLTED